MPNKTNEMPVKIEAVPQLFKEFQRNIVAERMQAALVMAYLAGHQQRCVGAHYDSIADIYYDWEKRAIPNYVDNILKSPFRNLLSTMSAKLIEPKIVPGNGKEEFAESSEEYNKALEYLRNQEWKYPKKAGCMAYLGLATGSVYSYLSPAKTEEKSKYFLTADGKKITSYTKQGENYIANGKALQGKEIEQPEAALDLRHYSLWDMAHSMDGETKTANDASWTIAKDIVNLGWLKSNYPDFNIDQLHLGDECNSIADSMQADLRNAIAQGLPDGVVTLTGDDRQVTLYTMHHRPGGKFTRGWVVKVISADKDFLLDYKPTLPLTSDKYTIMPVRQWDVAISNPIRPVQQSPLWEGIGLQIVYNSLLNSRIIHERKLANPPRTEYEGTVSEKLNKDDGSKIVWAMPPDEELQTAYHANPAIAQYYKPSYENLPGTPGSVIELMNRIKEDLINVIGTALANPGSLPKSGLSGISIENQAAVDQQGQVSMIQAWNQNEKELYLDAIKAITIVYPQEQLAFILNEDLHKFDQLYDNDIEDSFDIKFADLSQSPVTPMGKLQELNSLRQIIPPEYQDNVLQYMDTVLKGMGYELDFSDQEMELADKENEYIIHGLALKCKVDKGQIIIPPEVQMELTAMVNPLQTAGKHLTKHMPIVIGPKWLEYGPVVAACLTMHIKQHERVDDDKQIGQMEGQIKVQQALKINQQPIQGEQGNGQAQPIQ